MTLRYSLDENDFLQQQLFVASKNKRIQNKRRKSWILASVSVLAVAFLFYENGNRTVAYGMFAFLVFTIFSYPSYLRSQYKSHYRKFIADAYKERVGLEAIMTFTDDQIELSDRAGETKINLIEIAGINETGEYFYVRMKMGESLIIPKQKIDSSDIVRQKLVILSEKLRVPFASELDWRWR